MRKQTKVARKQTPVVRPRRPHSPFEITDRLLKAWDYVGNPGSLLGDDERAAARHVSEEFAASRH